MFSICSISASRNLSGIIGTSGSEALRMDERGDLFDGEWLSDALEDPVLEVGRKSQGLPIRVGRVSVETVDIVPNVDEW